MTHSECVNKAHSAPHCKERATVRALPEKQGSAACLPTQTWSHFVCARGPDCLVYAVASRWPSAASTQSNPTQAITRSCVSCNRGIELGVAGTLLARSRHHSLSVWLSTLSSSCHLRLAVKHAVAGKIRSVMPTVLLRCLIDSVAPLLKPVGSCKRTADLCFLLSQLHCALGTSSDLM